MIKLILNIIWIHGFLRGYLGCWNNHKYLWLSEIANGVYNNGFVRGVSVRTWKLKKIFWKPIIKKKDNRYHVVWLNKYFVI